MNIMFSMPLHVNTFAKTKVTIPRSILITGVSEYLIFKNLCVHSFGEFLYRMPKYLTYFKQLNLEPEQDSFHVHSVMDHSHPGCVTISRKILSKL